MDDDTTRHLVDGQLGNGVWDATKDKALKVFKKGKRQTSLLGLFQPIPNLNLHYMRVKLCLLMKF